jgi:hypothetical protein
MAAASARVGDTVRVRRWHARYCVPSTHPAPARLRDQLDAMLRDDLPRALAALLAHTLPADDAALVFVRELAFDIAIDAALDRDAIAAQCARALTATLARELAAGDSANVVRFVDRSEYLGRFLADTASGDAASRWYYGAFAGLAALPASAAIRTVLLDRQEAGLAALRTLGDTDLAQVIAALGPREGARVRDTLAQAAPGGDAACAFAELVAVWQARTAPVSPDAPAQIALWLLARCAAPPDRALARAAQALGVVIAALASGRITPSALATVEDRENGAMATLFAGSAREVREALQACPRALLAELRAPRGPEITATPAGGEAFGSTVFGGAFLLLDDLSALPLADLTEHWPQWERTAPARALGMLVLACCCGGSRAGAFFADPLWRRLFGIDPALTLATLCGSLAALGRARERTFARMLVRPRRDGDAALTSHRLDVDGAYYRVRIDEHGIWRALTRARDDDTATSRAAVADGDALADDLAYLRLAHAPLPPAWSCSIALAAQQVLKNFVRRIPGYSASHLRYTQKNFLDLCAGVEAETARIVVRLARPPLALMLNFAGVNRGERRWPLLDPRTFALFTEC